MKVIQLALAIICLATLSGCNLENDVDSEESVSQSQTQEEEKLSLEHLVAVTSVALAHDYDQNSIAADQIYKGKRFKVTGVIVEFNTDLSGDSYISLSGTKQDYEPRFYFDDNALSQVATLNKGETITLVCIGKGYIADGAISDSCQIVPPKSEAIAQPSTAPIQTLVEERTPKFSDYPVSDIYEGPPAKLVMDNDVARDYRTQFNENLSRAPSFAGEYIGVAWGCGAQCVSQHLINKRTGKVLSVGFGGEFGEIVEEMRVDSRLIVTKGGVYDDDFNETDYKVKFYVLEGEQLRVIKEKSIPRPTDEQM